MFIGRIEDRKTASLALQLAGIETDAGYEDAVQRLSSPAKDGTPPTYREFLWRDPDGQVEKLVTDLAWAPHVLEAVRTDAADDTTVSDTDLYDDDEWPATTYTTEEAS